MNIRKNIRFKFLSNSTIVFLKLFFFIIIYLIFLFSPFLTSAQKKESRANFGNASFYHDSFNGKETSNGETYDKDDFTAAHLSYPFNTILLVTNKKNNKSIVVRVNDRGPFKRSRIIDLSRSAAKKIDMVPFGVVPVKIKVLNFLNPSIMNDSLLNNGDVWDCYGNKKAIADTSIFLWKTKYWKHAFYMASCLSLEYKLNSIFVQVNGIPDKRSYSLFVTNFENENSFSKLITTFVSDGFFEAKIIYSDPSRVKQHDDQSTK